MTPRTNPEAPENQVKALTKSIGPLVQGAMALTIATPAEFETAASVLRDVKRQMKEATELRFSITRPLDDAKKRILDLFDIPVRRLMEAERALKGSMLDFQNTEARRLREEQAAAEEARQAELDRLHKAEVKALEAGKPAKAAALAQLSEAIPEVEEAAPTRVSGVSTRTLYRAEVTDFEALVKGVASGDFPLHLLEPNMTALNKLAAAGRGALTIPGVSVRSEQSMAAGR